MAFVRVCSIHDVKPGHGKVVDVNGEEVALFNVNGNFFATTNSCPHRNGPLGEGYLDNDIVSCPLHGWKFNVRDGKNLTIPSSKIACFQVKVEGNDVMIEG